MKYAEEDIDFFNNRSDKNVSNVTEKNKMVDRVKKMSTED